MNKVENRIMLTIKTGYYLELVTPETIKLLGSTKSKITKDKNGEDIPYLEIAEVVLIHCNVVDNSYLQILEFCRHLFLIKHSVNY